MDVNYKKKSTTKLVKKTTTKYENHITMFYSKVYLAEILTL